VHLSIFQYVDDTSNKRLHAIKQYESDTLKKEVFYNASNQVIKECLYIYNKKGQLQEDRTTFKLGHEYDLIRQFTYSENGKKQGMLFGNNRTGKWESHRYHYNDRGDIDTFFQYQKNGDFKKKEVISHQ